MWYVWRWSSLSFRENRRRAVELLRGASNGRIQERGNPIVAGFTEFCSCQRAGEHALELRIDVVSGRNRDSLLGGKGSEFIDRCPGQRRPDRERIERRRNADIGGHVATDPLEREIVLTNTREPEWLRILPEPNVWIDAATTVHDTPLIRLAARPANRIPIGAGHAIVVSTTDGVILALDDSAARRTHVADYELDHRAIGHREARHQQRLAECRPADDECAVDR